MRELLYIEVPVPETARVRDWLQLEWRPPCGHKLPSVEGARVRFAEGGGELSAFVWSLQRTTYLKLFADDRVPAGAARRIRRQLARALRQQFPLHYPELPAIASERSIFEELAPYFPLTVKYFGTMPSGEADLRRAYWWEQRWRARARQPQPAIPVVFRSEVDSDSDAEAAPIFDLIYIGGALGAIHAVAMARLGYRVLLVERLPFGRMNREWNISRAELRMLVDLGVLTAAECESTIAREYVDGFSKFFDANVPPALQAEILHTPTVLNVALDSERLLHLCGDNLRRAGGEIWDQTEFLRADVGTAQVTVKARHLPSGEARVASGRLAIDAMGSASPIAWQLNGARAFDSVCPTVGAVVSNFPPGVWDSRYGDVLNSHGDISRGRQLIWELFPGAGDDLTFYLFHYHQVHPDNPGSLLEMYEDFFAILPEYRRCNPASLTWKKPTFGYIPGHFSLGSRDRVVAFDRLLALGDAASLQSPLVFTGFGSLVRNLPRLSVLLDVALKGDTLRARDLQCIRAYQSNVSVTWLFSKGMMVPTGQTLPPQRINAMLNTFFGLLAQEPTEVADRFIKDRVDWLTFNRLALKAAWLNPALIGWIWEQAGAKDFLRWIGSYLAFTRDAAVGWLLRGWFPDWVRRMRPQLETRNPAVWLRLLAISYNLTAGLGIVEDVEPLLPPAPALLRSPAREGG
ncbi:hypothetical protein KR51_00021900 [Rubidibacter lacunae KORDI 51-2]|uniref:Flavin-dependent dehydrogenase n=1 Tax=Rubidibacter lacunae KORDI 51-2 TaxID=582515 RepID=U5DHT8_9CHRO|nr:hypothetical protein [Rubidibacter lacunae]ERN41216.1 hypothetical protein KR51_00021900 [Rubidibacter lacunae KORDI 51-2]